MVNVKRNQLEVKSFSPLTQFDKNLPAVGTHKSLYSISNSSLCTVVRAGPLYVFS